MSPRVLASTLAAGALLLGGPPAAAQPLAVFPALAPADRAAPPFTLECTVWAGARVCRQFLGDDGLVVRATRPGQAAARWRLGSDPPVEDGFAVFGVGNGLATARLDAISNGLGIHYWTVESLPPTATAPAYRFTVEDFGRGGESFGTWRGQTVLWATEWVSGPDPSGRRGGGLYLVGRPFRMGVAGLEPVRDLPVRARRLLTHFQTTAGGPVVWLRHPTAESRRTDPALAGCRPTDERATVRRVSGAVTDDGVPFHVLALGSRALAYGVADTPDRPAVTHVGAGGRLFPPAYWRTDWERSLAGRSVRISTCAMPDGVQARVLWLD